MACPALQYFSTLPHKRNDFRKHVTEYKMFVLIFSTTFAWKISHSKNWAKFDQTCILSDFNEIWIFATDFRKILKCQISWKSVQWEESCSMQKDRHGEANSRFSQFSKVPRKSISNRMVSRLSRSQPGCWMIRNFSFTTCLFFYHGATAPLGLPIIKDSRSHSTHHIRQDSSGRQITPTQKPLPDNTQHSL